VTSRLIRGTLNITLGYSLPLADVSRMWTRYIGGQRVPLQRPSRAQLRLPCGIDRSSPPRACHMLLSQLRTAQPQPRHRWNANRRGRAPRIQVQPTRPIRLPVSSAVGASGFSVQEKGRPELQHEIACGSRCILCVRENCSETKGFRDPSADPPVCLCPRSGACHTPKHSVDRRHCFLRALKLAGSSTLSLLFSVAKFQLGCTFSFATGESPRRAWAPAGNSLCRGHHDGSSPQCGLVAGLYGSCSRVSCLGSRRGEKHCGRAAAAAFVLCVVRRRSSQLDVCAYGWHHRHGVRGDGAPAGSHGAIHGGASVWKESMVLGELSLTEFQQQRVVHAPCGTCSEAALQISTILLALRFPGAVRVDAAQLTVWICSLRVVGRLSVRPSLLEAL